MTTQNRYYSNLGQGTFITNTGGLTASGSALTVQTNTHWPSQFPFTVRLEPGTANEEVALVTSGAGTAGSPYQLTRGYDSTNQLPHAQGASVIPGFCQLDFSQPSQHINLTGSASGAHGLPPSAWAGGSQQLIHTYSYTDFSGVNLNISSIPQTFNHLKVVYALRGNGTTAGHYNTDCDALQLQVNGITTATYNGIYTLFSPSTSLTASASALGGAVNCGIVWNNVPGTDGIGVGHFDIYSYATSAGTKSIFFEGSATDHGSSAACYAVLGWAGPGGHFNTNPVTSMQLSVSGSSTALLAGNVWLYGII